MYHLTIATAVSNTWLKQQLLQKQLMLSIINLAATLSNTWLRHQLIPCSWTNSVTDLYPLSHSNLNSLFSTPFFKDLINSFFLGHMLLSKLTVWPFGGLWVKMEWSNDTNKQWYFKKHHQRIPHSTKCLFFTYYLIQSLMMIAFEVVWVVCNSFFMFLWFHKRWQLY